jgi:pyridinium-3,5-biscarboxylic acid mononucleotide sulfurtransferase
LSDRAEARLAELREWMRPLGSALVAYSGGVDSALVLAAAQDVLGERVLACIGVSPSYAEREREAAIALAQGLGAAHRLVETGEVLDPDYARNLENRCFFCKSHLYERLSEIARAEGFAAILDGTQQDDLGDVRPGRDAAARFGVRSPLLELRIGKREIRELALHLGLPVWDKPAMPCLASRVPHGTAISVPMLRQIERAEGVLSELGFRQYRVRHHGEIARIELPPDELARAVTLHESLVAGVRAAGYRHVCLDLSGMRAGALEAPWVAVEGVLVPAGGRSLP